MALPSAFRATLKIRFERADMVLYRRNRVSGGTYFFTVTLRNRGSDILVRHVDLLKSAFRDARRSNPFTMDGVVILPDHLHAIWTLPANDCDFPRRWQAIKSKFTRLLLRQGMILRPDAKGEYDLWQRRYWEHTIRDQEDYMQHLDYIHFNPVKHGLVKSVCDWPYSSFHRYVHLGLLSLDWGGGREDNQEGFGE